MARITVEDCVLKVSSRFELVLLASQRAREISAGAPLSVDRDNDKNPVVALREIAEETIDRGKLYESLVQSLQQHVESDEPDEDELDLLTVEQEPAGPSVETGAEPLPEGGISKDLPSAEESAGDFEDLARKLLAEEAESFTDEGKEEG